MQSNMLLPTGPQLTLHPVEVEAFLDDASRLQTMDREVFDNGTSNRIAAATIYMLNSLKNKALLSLCEKYFKIDLTC